jgi:hypothetical protein
MASAAQIASQQSEIHDLAARVGAGQPAERLAVLSRIIALDSQSVDCQVCVPPAQTVPEPFQPTYIKSRRFVAILNENYAERLPNLVQQRVQNILYDFDRPDPLVKGIAIRHAGRAVTDETADRLVPMIQRGAQNDDPYVRKATALAILNVHQAKPSLVSKYKLGPVLKQLVEDSNLNVAANAVAALTEINQNLAQPLFVPGSNTVNNLLAAIDQATEWSQIEILDFVAVYRPVDGTEARGVIQRVASRLSHANPGVVLSAVRCCLQMNSFVDDQAKVRETLTKIVLPLVTLLNNSPPVQFVGVKSILILLQKYRRMLASEVSIFFCKYDDPLYMKMAKLDVILTLANTQNVGKVLEELFDYAQQTDVEFVRKSIRAVGKVAVKFESAADACVDKIVSLVDTKGQYVVQECIVVAVDVFRRYPGKYEGIIANINAKLTGTLDDHRAKAAMAWILGEYCHAIGHPASIFNAMFVDEFVDETEDVQLAVLTAVVKFYLQSDDADADELLQKVLNLATNQIDNPDVRDRAFMYLGLIQDAGEEAGQVILPEHDDLPTLTVDFTAINPGLIDRLVPEIGTLSVLYDKVPDEFVESVRFINIDLGGAEGDSMNSGLNVGESSIEQMQLPVLVESGSAYGVEIRGSLVRVGELNSFVLRFRNYSEQPLAMHQIAFNKNVFGFAPGEFELPPSVGSQKSLTVQIPVIFSQAHIAGAQPSADVQIAALANREKPIFFTARARLDLILVPADQGGKLSREQFMQAWQQIDESCERVVSVQRARIDTIDVAKHKMQENRLYFAAKKDATAFFTGKTIKGEIVLAFIVFESGGVQIGVRLADVNVGGVILELLQQAIQ